MPLTSAWSRSSTTQPKLATNRSTGMRRAPWAKPVMSYEDWERTYSAGRERTKLGVDNEWSDEEEREPTTKSPQRSMDSQKLWEA